MRLKPDKPSRNSPKSKKNDYKRILHSFSSHLKANDISHHGNTSKLSFMSLSASSLYHVHIIISSRSFFTFFPFKPFIHLSIHSCNILLFCKILCVISLPHLFMPFYEFFREKIYHFFFSHFSPHTTKMNISFSINVGIEKWWCLLCWGCKVHISTENEKNRQKKKRWETEWVCLCLHNGP
jgi:hypothetical protein